MSVKITQLVGNKAALTKKLSVLEGDILLLFSIKNCSPCEVFKTCLPNLAEDFGNQFEIFEVPLVGTHDEANESKDHFAIKFYPTLRYLKNGETISDLKGALDAEDYVNYARIFKWLTRFFQEPLNTALE